MQIFDGTYAKEAEGAKGAKWANGRGSPTVVWPMANEDRTQSTWAVRAFSRVCQINLASIFFWQNKKKCSPTIWYPNLVFLPTW